MVKMDTLDQYISNINIIENMLSAAEIASNENDKFAIINLFEFAEKNKAYINMQSFSIFIDSIVDAIDFCNSGNYSNEGLNERFSILVHYLNSLLDEINSFYNVNVYFKGNDKYGLFDKIIRPNITLRLEEEAIQDNKKFNVLVISEETCNEEINQNNYDKIIYYDNFMNDCFRKVEQMYFSDYDYNFLLNNMLKSKESVITGMIVGSSYSLCGIDEGGFAENVTQLSLPSQDLYYSFKIAKDIIEENNSIKRCFIGTGYWTFHADLSKSQNDGYPRIQNVYYPIFEDSHNYNYSSIAKKASLSEQVDILINYIFNVHIIDEFLNELISKKNKSYYNQLVTREKGSIVGTRKLSSINVDEKLNMAKSRADLHNKMLIYSGTVDENTAVMKEFLDYLCNKNVEPIIINFPATSYYYKFFNQEFISRYKSIINELSKLYRFKFIDLNDYDIFDEDDFVDFDHLNAAGALKATGILNDLLENEG
jgi:hypothetical protein